jgi:hypothetical protein
LITTSIPFLLITSALALWNLKYVLVSLGQNTSNLTPARKRQPPGYAQRNRRIIEKHAETVLGSKGGKVRALHFIADSVRWFAPLTMTGLFMVETHGVARWMR